MMLYTLKHLKQTFGARCVLDIDSLEIEKGYIHALLGPNGSGKTTLLNILAFLEAPSEGHLWFQNQPVHFNETSLQKLRRKVVMVHQNPILFSTSVYKNIEFGLKIRKIEKKQRERIIDDALDMVGLRPFAREAAHKLSGGETQRIVLARALALSPEVILCDEPTASVDLENQVRIGLLLQRINREKGITLVFTSHDKRQAASLPHHRIYLEQGRTSRLSYENLFPIHLIDENIPVMQAIRYMEKDNTGVFVHHKRFRMDPTMILLNAEPGEERESASTRGTISRISQDGEMVRITLQCGVRLTAILSRQQYREKQAMVGDDVSITIPRKAISFLQ